MQRIVSPDIDSLPNLRQKLTAGERAVFELFKRKLAPAGWEIYTQPHLNGLRPDFVLLNPKIGIAVFEVKDWNLDAMRYRVESDGDGLPVLIGERDGVSFSIQKDNPVNKVNKYRKAIFDLYCPRLKENTGFAVITAGIIFPYANAKRVKELLEPFLNTDYGNKSAIYHPISGINEVRNSDIGSIFPESGRQKSYYMTEAHANDLRGWLVEPDFAKTQREPLGLDPDQRALVTRWPASRYRRIKGPAGSGKSLVLAARAAHRAKEEKSVLIVTFNITLWHYLRDLVVRATDGPGMMDQITFTHFHRFCKEVCVEAGYENQDDVLFKGSASSEDNGMNDHYYGVLLPQLAKRALESGKVSKYDTIMVDEGQDFQPEWWNVLRLALKEDGEMLLVADATQDVYSRAKAWTDEAMNGMGFSGDWARLKTGYRLPALAQDYARDFAKRFLPPSTVDLPDVGQGNLEIERCHLRWIQCPEEDGASACMRELELMMLQTGIATGVANADITFITDDTKVGVDVTRMQEEKKVRTVSTFNPSEKERRREKMGFYMGDARIKATTLHSFKGWEAILLLVYVSEFRTDENKALIYAALTRLKRSPKGSWLTVVCVASKLAEFGKTWPDHQDQPRGA